MTSFVPTDLEVRKTEKKDAVSWLGFVSEDLGRSSTSTTGALVAYEADS